jgi:hypothetical protein
MMCRTFTHHVEGKIRVECVAHPRWHEDAEKIGEHSARAVANAIAAEHEAGDPSVESSSSTPATGDLP